MDGPLWSPTATDGETNFQAELAAADRRGSQESS